jgi:UDP-glucose 4-epimerase
MAAEGLIAAYAHAGHLSATIFRFVSILGPRYTHGHVIDFVARLSKDPSRLPVLGDGTQRKSYLYVDDCIAAIKLRLATDPGLEVLNLGTDEFCKIADSARWIADRLGLSPTFEYSGGDRGWVGDNPFIFLDTAAMRTLGWAPKRTIRGAVEATVDWLVEHPDVLDAAITT